MDKQTELKAKIGEVQLEMDQIQVRYNQLVQAKSQYTQLLMQELKKPAEPEVKKKSK